VPLVRGCRASGLPTSAGVDAHGGGTYPVSEQRRQLGAVHVLSPVGVIDPIVQRLVVSGGDERDVSSDTAGHDAAGSYPHLFHHGAPAVMHGLHFGAVASGRLSHGPSRPAPGPPARRGRFPFNRGQHRLRSAATQEGRHPFFRVPAGINRPGAGRGASGTGVEGCVDKGKREPRIAECCLEPRRPRQRMAPGVPPRVPLIAPGAAALCWVASGRVERRSAADE
jgi:hypothetical protein